MSQAVPKLVQRFRARELQRLVDKTGLHGPRPGVTAVLRQDVNMKHVRMSTPLHNPFLPRPLFNRNATEISEKQQKKERKKWAQPHYSLRRQAVLVKLARASGTLHLLPPGPKLSVDDLEVAKREAKKRTKAMKKSLTIAKKSVVQANAAKVAEDVEGNAKTEDTSIDFAETSNPPLVSVGFSTVPAKSRAGRRRKLAYLGHPGVVFHWTGKVPTKARKGLTIYAGRRRMFKGHKWERHLEKRRAQIAVRMRDMPKRIARFKNVYTRKRAKPLKPAVPRKKESLPF